MPHQHDKAAASKEDRVNDKIRQLGNALMAMTTIVKQARADEAVDASTQAGSYFFIDPMSEAVEAAEAALAPLVPADERVARALKLVADYDSALNYQEIAPNGDDYNQLAHGIVAILRDGDVHGQVVVTKRGR